MLQLAHTQPAKSPRVDFDKVLASARKAPMVDLAPIEWDGEMPKPAAYGALGLAGDCPIEARRRRIRDRYIGARFPGVARGVADLESANGVIKAARHYFEDGRFETALELIELAIEEDARAESLWLAQLEILFLVRDPQRYVARAKEFRQAHPSSPHWTEVARLGLALAPEEKAFGPRRGPRVHDHYGPWPDLPNWIQASWDLTGEVLASDFHRLLCSSPARLHA